MSRGVKQPMTEEWLAFPGGELEGRSPKAICPSCRARSLPQSHRPPVPDTPLRHRARVSAPLLCFQCYRTDLDRQRALKAARELDTASDERFQTALPFEPVNVPRLEMLKAERATSRTAMSQGVGKFADRRRQAQIRARHALQRIAAGLATGSVTPAAKVDADRMWAGAIHAAEVQLPEAWLPFVVSR